MTGLRLLSCYIVLAGILLIPVLGIVYQVSKLMNPNPIVEDFSKREPLDIQYLVFNKMEH